jgi:uncharacterized protein YjbI with pentapeptide repeats
MISIITLILSFVLAVLGFLHSHAASPGINAIFGMTRLGACLILVATLGFAFGIIKEVQGISESRKLRDAENERTQMLKELHAKIIDEAKDASPEVAEQLKEIGDRIRMVASRSRESDFSMSDFARSNFAKGRFTEANFALSEFSGANFKRSLFRNSIFMKLFFLALISEVLI